MDRGEPLDKALSEAVFLSVGLPAPVALAFAGTRKLQQIALRDLTAAHLAQYQIAMVACPLIAADADALAVAKALQKAGYTGMLSVISPRLPNTKMIEDELRTACPGVRINVISL